FSNFRTWINPFFNSIFYNLLACAVNSFSHSACVINEVNNTFSQRIGSIIPIQWLNRIGKVWIFFSYLLKYKIFKIFYSFRFYVTLLCHFNKDLIKTWFVDKKAALNPVIGQSLTNTSTSCPCFC